MRSIAAINLEKGQEAILDEVLDEGLHRKLLSMGVQMGQSLTIVDKTLTGKSFYVKIGEGLIALRLQELNALKVKV